MALLDEYAARLTHAINAVARDESDAINRAATVIAGTASSQPNPSALLFVHPAHL